MKVITLGPEGTFSHEMATLIGADEIVLVPTIGRVFAEVVRTGTPGLVPLENSEAGGVTSTLDCLMQFPVMITLESYLPIHHCLAGTKGQISRIYAHPQSHEQCSRVIEDLNVPVIHTESNAASAIAQKSDPESAAIISERLAARHQIPLIRTNIENNACNITRFVQILPGDSESSRELYTKSENTGASPEKCSMIIDPDENRAGLLYDLLTPFKREGVNLTRIESRPSKRSMGTYVFFLDIQCDGRWREAAAELKQLAPVKYLGCYRRWHQTSEGV
nr:prephenate dehydratase domain-containing protein [uncultured Methanospirillum sp.]